MFEFEKGVRYLEEPLTKCWYLCSCLCNDAHGLFSLAAGPINISALIYDSKKTLKYYRFPNWKIKTSVLTKKVPFVPEVHDARLSDQNLIFHLPSDIDELPRFSDLRSNDSWATFIATYSIFGRNVRKLLSMKFRPRRSVSRLNERLVFSWDIEKRVRTSLIPILIMLSQTISQILISIGTVSFSLFSPIYIGSKILLWSYLTRLHRSEDGSR